MEMRTKSEVLLEQWGTLDLTEIHRRIIGMRDVPFPDVKKCTKLKLPYQAPSCPPLPSWQEILAATKTHSLHMLNIGLHPEAETLLFLAEKRPQLRIPTVLAAWTVMNEYNNPVNCLMMEFIEGIALDDDNFSKLSIQAQDTICAKVSSQLQYLRELAPEEHYYGRVHRQGWQDPPPAVRGLNHISQDAVGPFDTYEEFARAMCQSDESECAVQDMSPEFHPLSVSHTASLWSMLCNWEPHEPKFTWIDPKIRNLVVRPVEGDDGNDWEVFLIDWECCGWYPAWLQALQCAHRFRVWLIDRSSKPPKIWEHREGELVPSVLKDVEPKADLEKLAVMKTRDWHFF
ncbi:hypothetical protein K491DRAFT_738415 [Lophiostoma macrostomum CBS 122681]|uniref:Aminoglycoside phosphotransferase domain-containing protein n=1 Tax=Lophiostoma macrostomum CBS 122681 TaxID=1314788 RepID=A0A6A6SK04_9PLEO|nr:hypothetical protein K491DRAFT_738415 [Lophiostoma macrostomum CBS 122681]